MFVQEKTEEMVHRSKVLCDFALSEEKLMQLDGLVVHEKGSEFSLTKRGVLRHALPEIVKHVSETNVEMAASISELLVQYTLTCLDNIKAKLVSVSVRVCVQLCIRVCVHACMCVCTCVHLCVRARVYMCMSVRVCLCCLCVCVL